MQMVNLFAVTAGKLIRCQVVNIFVDIRSIAVKMLLEKAFKEFDMHKVYSYVFAEFPDEMELLKRAGFRVEAILHSEAVNAKGTYSDAVRLCVLDKEFDGNGGNES